MRQKKVAKAFEQHTKYLRRLQKIVSKRRLRENNRGALEQQASLMIRVGEQILKDLGLVSETVIEHVGPEPGDTSQFDFIRREAIKAGNSRKKEELVSNVSSLSE